MTARRGLALALGLAALAACGGNEPGAAPDAADTTGDSEADAATDPGDDAATETGDDATSDDATTAGDADDVTSPFDPAPLDAPAEFESFFRIDRVQRLELRVDQSEWDGLVAHMLAYAAIDGAMRTGRYFRATLVHTDPDGVVTTLPDVGFRTRGNTTRVVPEDADGVYHRAHFKLKFDLPFDLEPGSEAAVARDARRFAGLSELSLKWNRDDDPSQIRELFAYELFRKVGVLAPRVAPVALTITIGGRPIYFGLYLGIEGVDARFLRKRLGDAHDDGDLYKCLWQSEGPATLEPVTNPRAVGVKDWAANYRPAYDLATNEATSHHERLRELIGKLHDLQGDALASWLDAHFDVEGFLRFLAVNVLVGMPDDYWAMGNNYYLYFGPDRGRFIPWDYDHGLGGGWGGEPVWSWQGIAESDVFVWKNLNAAWWSPSTTHPLVDKILDVPRYRARYADLLRALVDPRHALFAVDAWSALEAAQQALYAPWLVNDTGEGEVMEDTGVERAYFETRLRAVTQRLASP